MRDSSLDTYSQQLHIVTPARDVASRYAHAHARARAHGLRNHEWQTIECVTPQCPSGQRVVPKQCGLRWCDICSQSRARRERRSLEQKVNELIGISTHTKRVKMVTLTVANGLVLEQRIKHLKNSFRILKQHPIWKSEWHRGHIEVSNSGKGWHPHLHILVFGDFMHFRALSKAWHGITGDSMVVDIRQIYGRGAKSAVFEACKYAAKPQDVWKWSRVMKDHFQSVVSGMQMWVGDSLSLIITSGFRRCPGCLTTAMQVVVATRQMLSNFFYGTQLMRPDRPLSGV